MTNFTIYYKQQFKQDLLNFLRQIPIEGNKHYRKQEFTIQYFFLTPNYIYLDIIPTERQPFFTVALYWTVLIDQVFYSSYNDDYLTFQRNSLYPKFIGNCTAPSLMSSQCGHNQNPKRILEAINDFNDEGNSYGFDREIFAKDEKKTNREKIYIDDLIEQSKATIKSEIKNYFDIHQPNISWEDFWDKCLKEL